MNLDVARRIVSCSTGIGPELVTVDLAAGAMPGWDSLGHMRIVLAVEAHLGREFTTDEIMEIQSVRDVAAILDSAGTA